MKHSTSHFCLLLPVVLLAMLLQGCEDEEPTQPAAPRPRINGSVVKGDGKPLDSAEVVLLFHTGTASDMLPGQPFLFPNPAETSTLIHYTVPAPNTFVSARVIDMLFHSTAAEPLNVVAQAGEFSNVWDLKEHSDSAHTLRNGWYQVRLDVGGQVQTNALLINSENSVPFAVSDSLGKFFIDYRNIPYDSTAHRTTGLATVLGRYEVLDSVTVLVRRRGYPSQRKGIGINRSQSVDIKFTF